MMDQANNTTRPGGTDGGRVSERGFTLVECLFALAILGAVMTSLMPSFINFMDANSNSESRSDAVAAAQQIMESLRRQDPAGWPSSGSSATEVVAINNREFEVVKQYCLSSKFCGSASRHVVVEVSYGGKVLYSVESVFTRLQ